MALKAGYYGIKKKILSQLLGLPDDILNIRSEQAVLGAVNFLENKLVNATDKGITVVKNSDGSVTVTGTATEGVNFDVNRVVATANILSNLEVGKTYILKGCPKNGGTQKYGLVMNKKIGETVTYHYDIGDGLKFTYDGTFTSYSIFIQVWPAAGTNINLTFKPQIALSKDTPYAPYAMTNRELTLGLQDVTKVTRLTSADNLNDIKTFGHYEWTVSPPVNAPENVTYCHMDVIPAGGVIKQVIYYGPNLIYMREYAGSPIAWSSWYKFSGTRL